MRKSLAAKSSKFQNNSAESQRQPTRTELKKTQPVHPVGKSRINSYILGYFGAHAEKLQTGTKGSG